MYLIEVKRTTIDSMKMKRKEKRSKCDVNNRRIKRR